MAQTGDRATTTLQLFTISMSSFGRDPAPKEDSDEVELSLGLSLNGRFGVEPMRAKLAALKRSSSISDFSSPAAVPMMSTERTKTTCRIPREASCHVGPLMRTWSLPTETEEEWRRRKEMQSLRRMEAKRKRSEKQQRTSINHIINCHNTKLVRHLSRENFDDAAAAVNCHHPHPLPPLLPPPESQGTVGSQGSGSSVITEADNSDAAAQGVHKCTETRSGGGVDVELLPKNEREPLATPTTAMASETTRQLNEGVQMQNHCNKPTSPDKETKEEIVKNVLEKMPCVSTTGHGPGGKRIEGFLYRYKKGEEVRIVCVCHGSFLTPAEFVKHAGGGDVTHPLKHIVVSPTPTS